MSKLNHGRPKYALSKAKDLELEELQNKKDPGPQIIGFGKHKNTKIRAAELIMTDPQYFYWAYYSGALKQDDPWLEFQAWEIIQKAAHIRAPRHRPDSWEFAMYFEPSGRFLDFQIVKKSDVLKPRKGLLRVKHLDMSLVSLADEKACAKMVERIHEEFLPDKKLTHWDYQEFWDKDRNFDVSCREIHCPKIPRRVNERVCPNYDGKDGIDDIDEIDETDSE